MEGMEVGYGNGYGPIALINRKTKRIGLIDRLLGIDTIIRKKEESQEQR